MRDFTIFCKRSQSEVVGVLLLTSVIVILVGIVGLFVLSGQDTTREPVADIEVTANESVVWVTHNGGDDLVESDVRVTFGRSGDGEWLLEEFDDADGSADRGRFEGGDRRVQSHSATGVISVTVVHVPTNTVLAQEFLDVPGSTPIASPGPTPTPTPTPTPRPTPTPETIRWENATDWNAATDESGVVHEDFGNHDAGRVELGYPTTAPGLVGYWPLDDDSNAQATDESGTGNDGDIQGDSVLDGQGVFGTPHFELGGDGDYLNVSHDASLETSDEDAVTVSAWVNKDTSQSGWIALFQKSDQSYNLQFANGNEPTFTIYDSDWREANSGLSVSNDQWYHLVGTFDGSEVRIYVDGRLAGTASATEIDQSGEADVGIGENLVSPGRELDGRIDEVRVYDRALSANEVSELNDTATTGSFTTGAKTFSETRDVSQLELRNLDVSRPSEVTVRVESDPDGDGDYEEISDEIALDGSATYDVTGLSTDSDRFRLDVEFESPDVTQSPFVNGVTLWSGG